MLTKNLHSNRYSYCESDASVGSVPRAVHKELQRMCNDAMVIRVGFWNVTRFPVTREGTRMFSVNGPSSLLCFTLE